MKILLINNNPVVSRLTALSARKEDIEIDEIQEVTELNADKYDIVFVDADSWSKDVEDVISENISVEKKVLFYAQDDNLKSGVFDIRILKPFLPSEVSAVIRSVEESKSVVADVEEVANVEHFDILEDSKNENRESLFELEEVSAVKSVDVESSNDKVDLMDELTKIDEGVVDEKDVFDQKLEEAFPLMPDSFDDELFEKTLKPVDKDLKDFAEKSEEDLFELDLDDEKCSLDEELFREEPKNVKTSSSDDLLDFDFDKSDELDFKIEETFERKNVESDVEVETEIETKILDKSEVSNIKEILKDTNNDIIENDTMELEDLMTTSMPAMALSEVSTPNVEKKEEDKSVKKKSKKEKKSSTDIEKTTFVDTLSNLKVESLKELLAGATVNITIEFPKD